jgi:hypothetical protein
MPPNFMTLTRQSLYDLVWSTPMSTLAKDLGISGVAALGDTAKPVSNPSDLTRANSPTWA